MNQNFDRACRNGLLPFKTAQHYYCFDGYSNKIYEVDPGLFEFLISGRHVTESEPRIVKEIIQARNTTEYCSFSSRQHKSVLDTQLASIYRRLLEVGPEVVTLETTTDCNFVCGYCAYHSKVYGRRRASRKMMSWDTARRAIRNLIVNKPREGKRFLSFYGGEPLMNFDLVKRCFDYCRRNIHDQDLDFHITTNGSLLSSMVIYTLAEMNISLTISLDGTSFFHDRYRRFKGRKRSSFKKVIENVNLMVTRFPEYYQNCVTFASTRPSTEYGSSIQDIKDLMGKYPYLKGKFVRLGVIDSFGWPFEKLSNQAEDKIYDQMRKKFILGLLNSEFKDDSGLLELIFEPGLKRVVNRCPKTCDRQSVIRLGQCWIGNRNTFVNVDGLYYVCEKRDYGTPIGNIDLGYDLYSIMEYEHLLHGWILDNCITCPILQICNECIANPCLFASNEYLRERLCYSNIIYIKEALEMFASICEANPVVLNGLIQGQSTQLERNTEVGVYVS